MQGYYLAIVILIFVLAIFDLFVGVSNDAVNFLNSAIGAKVASFRTIIIVAATGVFLGAAMSNGMMEIARHGIFRPAMFSFKDVMTIFIAVMASDIVLLDVFNTLGMPTSTTVSMVFELLGGTFAIALVKMSSDPSLDLGSQMNTSKALSMIMAIFVSVAIAFFFGTVIQWLSRVFFTFTYKKGMKWKIGLFGGLAATAILYFMLIKGISNFKIISPEAKEWMNANTWAMMGGCFVVCTAVMQILHAVGVNVFKVLVLMGTFALAMAFAGNDLVNFIGVPLAGFSSYTDYVASGCNEPSGLMMSSLDSAAKTPALFLIGAGVIMVIALATSKKALNVVKTSVDLSRQDEGDEMFGSSKAARVIARACTNMAVFIDELIPQGTKDWIESRFNKQEAQTVKGAAFDEVRATVNLVVASLLIALGTSLKLPLSTTYVTFMVAMGSSLADRAWGRESAVFRITGVMSVIGGWFITAGAAFVLCFLVAAAMYFGGTVVTILLICLAVFLLLRSNVRYNKEKDEEKSDTIYARMLESTDKAETLRLLTEHNAFSDVQFLRFANEAYQEITDGLVKEDLKLLDKAEDKMRKERAELKSVRQKELIGLRLIDSGIAIQKSTWFHLGRNSCEDILYCLRRMCDACQEHIDNNFVPLSQDRVKEFIPLRDTVLFLFRRVEDIIERGTYDDIEKVRSECDQFEESLQEARKKQYSRMQTSKDNITMSYVYLNTLQESQQILSSLRHLLRAANNFQEDSTLPQTA